MADLLPGLLLVAGVVDLGVLLASAAVPFKLDWRGVFDGLPKLHRQLYWVYGGYVVLGIVAIGAITLVAADEIASGSTLGRAFAGYAALFWGVRLALVAVLDAKPFLTAWYWHAGYHALTAAFVFLVLVYGYAAVVGGGG